MVWVIWNFDICDGTLCLLEEGSCRTVRIFKKKVLEALHAAGLLPDGKP